MHAGLEIDLLALLIDERCISAGEGWASWFIANKRARTFGTEHYTVDAKAEFVEQYCWPAVKT